MGVGRDPGGIGPNLGRLGAALRKPGEKNQEMIEIFHGEVVRLIGVPDRILGDGHPFLAGPYSIGDIMHDPWLEVLLDLGSPNRSAWWRGSSASARGPRCSAA